MKDNSGNRTITGWKIIFVDGCLVDWQGMCRMISGQKKVRKIIGRGVFWVE